MRIFTGSNQRRKVFILLSLYFLFSTPAYAQKLLRRLDHIDSHMGVSCIYLADFDNDGDQDIVAGHSYDTIVWYRNDGNWSFTEASMLTTGMNVVRYVSAGDIDNDGDMDVLAASRDDGKIAIFRNDGLGNFSDMELLTDEAPSTRFVEGVDIDNDSDMDIIASFYNTIVWFENIENNSFSEMHTILNVSSPRMAIADMDNDGDIDICTTAINEDGGLIWLKNNGDKSFTIEEVYFTIPSLMLDVSLFDLKNDGLIDIIAVGEYLEVAENIGGGKFLDFTSINNKSFNYFVVDACDLNKNGYGDVIVTPYEDNMFLSQYDEDGSDIVYLDINNCQGIAKSRHADIDGDGDLDLIVANYDDIIFFENILPEILSQPQSKTVCAKESTSFSVEVKDERYINWFKKESDDDYFNEIKYDGDVYSGVHSKQLFIHKPDISLNGAQYYCRVAYDYYHSSYSDIVELHFYEDTIAPILNTKSAVLYLSKSTFTKLNPEILIDELSDNCLYTDTTLSKNIFYCEDLGEEIITVTALDGWGNQVQQNALLTIIDTIPPEFHSYFDTIELFTSGSSYLFEDNRYTPSLVYDNCSLFSLTNSLTNSETLEGAIIPLGRTAIRWTATDYSGNVSRLYTEVIVKNENEYSIYPNPCREKVSIEQKYYGKYDLSIVSFDGKVLFSEDDVSDKIYELDTRILKRGYYLVMIANGVDLKAYQLVKTK